MIVGLTVKNFLGLTELDITPGKVTVVSGANGVGKSSVLKAIEAAFQARGEKANVIHLGADKAEVLVDLGEMQISRRITAAGNYLNVTREDAKLNKPQAVLDDLIGPALVFNPVDFFLADAKEHREMLLRAVPIVVTPADLEEWFGDAAREVDCTGHGLEVLAEVQKLLYEDRAAANAVVKDHENRVAALSERIPDGFDVAKWRAADVSGLAATIRETQDARNRLAQINDGISAVERDIDVDKHRKATLEEQLAVVNLSLMALATNLSALETERDAIEIPDDAEAQNALAAHSEAMATLRDVDALEEEQGRAAADAAHAEHLNDALRTAREKPRELLAVAELPIDGLEIAADSITLNGVNLDNLSDSEKLLVGLQIAKALSGEFRILCIDGAELLDDDNFQTLLDEAAGDEYQYFVTRVGQGELTISNAEGSDECRRAS